ncbi:MAG: penicillin acylase family protein, partial [Kiloniellaceae bacterium]
MGRAVKFSLGAVLALVLALGLAAGGAYWWMLGSLPRLDGTLAVTGLDAPVEVLRDGDGIVTIRAESERDAAFALGYAHAQDRLWQMDFMRRTGAGRLSEVAGARTLRLDRFMRTLGLYRTAQANVEHLSPPVRALLDVYAAGVNAVIEDDDATLPIEFQIMRYRPEPWRPADSLIWARLMSLQLSGNWSDELLRARTIRRLGPARAADLWPPYPADGPVALPDLAGALDGLALERFASPLPWALAPKEASNSWVVSGTLTATGAPILANDPHLTLDAPGVWYLARIETPERTFTGATAPGLPIPVLGQSGEIAWGFTTTESDTQDLFVERPAPDAPGLYATPDGPAPFETREEIIKVRGAAPEQWTVRATRHGPVISDAILAAPKGATPEGDTPATKPATKTVL